jgi:preprotein translocase subunit SecA
MEFKILKSITMMTLLFTSVFAYGQQDPKVEKGRKDSVKAENKIRLAKIDSAADFQKFKIKAEKQIEANKKQIAVLKHKKQTGTKAANAKYDKDVAALEQKNGVLRVRIDTADDTPTSGWDAFKQSFNNSMDDLGCAMKNVGTCDK